MKSREVVVSNARNSWMLLALLVAVSGGFWFVNRSTSHKDMKALRGQSQVSSRASDDQQVKDMATPAPSREVKNEVLSSPEKISSPSVLEPDWKKAHPDFYPFQRLHSLALRRSTDQDEYRDLLKSPFLLRRAEELLTSFESLQPSVARDHRIYAVNYLYEAVAWKENPNRREILASLQRLAVSPISKELGSDSDQIQDIFGDRVEVMMMMIHEDYTNAIRTYATMKDPVQRKLFNYALAEMSARMDEIAKK